MLNWSSSTSDYYRSNSATGGGAHSQISGSISSQNSAPSIGSGSKIPSSSMSHHLSSVGSPSVAYRGDGSTSNSSSSHYFGLGSSNLMSTGEATINWSHQSSASGMASTKHVGAPGVSKQISSVIGTNQLPHSNSPAPHHPHPLAPTDWSSDLTVRAGSSGSDEGPSDDSDDGLEALTSLGYNHASPFASSAHHLSSHHHASTNMDGMHAHHHVMMSGDGSTAHAASHILGSNSYGAEGAHMPAHLCAPARQQRFAHHQGALLPTSPDAPATLGTTKFSPGASMRAPRAKRAKHDENHISIAASSSVSTSSAPSTARSALSTSPSSSSPPQDDFGGASSSASISSTSPRASSSSSTTPRLRRSAALAAKAIKDEMADSYEANIDDDDIDVAPGSGVNRKRKRGEQQKAKHNVAEKRRRIEMNDAMDRIKACLSQNDRQDEARPATTKVSILLETADHLENLQYENERLKQQLQALSARMQHLEQEVAHYRGESTDDTTSLVSSPGNDAHRSPRSRLAVSLTSATLLTILFCFAWTPAQNMFQAHLPDTVALSRSLMQHAEASSYEFIFRIIHLITENVLPTITFVLSLLITLYAYSVLIRPIISDKDLIAAHLETVTAIHSARVHGGKTAWMKALKLSQHLGMSPPKNAWMAVPHIVYELLRWLAVHLWFGVFAERAVYFLRGVTPEELDKNCELEVSLAQCLVELCPDTDWGIAATMIRALNLCVVAPNRRFVNGERVVPLYKVKLWAFGAQRLLTHFSVSYRLLAWYCTRSMTKFSKDSDAKQAVVSAKDAKIVVDFPASTTRAHNRSQQPIESPENILGRPMPQHQSKEDSKAKDKAIPHIKEIETVVETSHSDAASNSGPKYVVSTQDDATLFNVMMPVTDEPESQASNGEQKSNSVSASSNCNDSPNSSSNQSSTSLSTTSSGNQSETRSSGTSVVSQKDSSNATKAKRSIETTYRSVCLVHEIAAHMLAGRMDTADTALAELIAIRQSNLPLVSRVSMERLHTAHVIPFTRWGTLRTQLMRALVQGVQGKHKEAVAIAVMVQQEADACRDVETRCASVLLATHFLLLSGHVESAAQQLSQLLLDPQAVACLMSDAQQYSALRAAWILLEANDTNRDRIVENVDFVIDERFIVELKQFVNGLEARRDHRFETLYYLMCVTEAALNAWQRLEEATSHDVALHRFSSDDDDDQEKEQEIFEDGKMKWKASEKAARTALVSATPAALSPLERQKRAMLEAERGDRNGISSISSISSLDELGSSPRNASKRASSSALRAMMFDQRASCFLNLKLLTRRALEVLGHAAGTGAFFLPAYHFLNAKIMLLSGGQSTNVHRVEKELASALSASWPSGRWSRDSLEASIEILHHDLLRPLIQVEDEGNGPSDDLDEPPTARTCS